MKDYECAVILSPALGADALKAATQKYSDVINSQGGTLTKIDEWGRRSMAYEIEDHREGVYYFYKFRGGGDTLTELNRQLRIDENVIRHMIVRDEYKVAAAGPEGEAASAHGEARGGEAASKSEER